MESQLTPRVRCRSLRNPYGGSVRSADAGRSDSIIAPIGFAHRTHMTGWSNVVSADVPEVFPTF